MFTRIFSYITVFLKIRNIISKNRRSKVTDFAALKPLDIIFQEAQVDRQIQKGVRVTVKLDKTYEGTVNIIKF